ncbi:MAG: hypothetical protein LUQ20_08075 [Candidatus Methanoperedens sp.]|nr:hypothetical protein [Candidatus Methanoperedens sp.]
MKIRQISVIRVLRNSIVHRYETLDIKIINEAKSKIRELEEIILKIVEY